MNKRSEGNLVKKKMGVFSLEEIVVLILIDLQKVVKLLSRDF